ncbi:Putative DNA alkylation repair enzyme [Mariniradius saccharolyticus AK6]|uniref:DNA alkylation repair enzyme n=1 Tax=Mariniradius saccharolyticus AK6 TaxID=1239962 RepID=M7XAB8_9BACT|nr:DNA alkylation repair protein [Mariniradius saccharolyticus]EMS31834.1 Putative DNA alkylation repair enzyme [Mariniradius saccharolyticus AK6]
MTASAIIQALSDLSNPEKAAFLPGFFKAFPGGYGDGDKFLGVTVPNQRKVAAHFAKKTTEGDLQQLIESPYHEVRLTALLILVSKFRKASEKGFWVDFYLRNLKYVNNWDLVDSSAHFILGEWLWDKDRKMLHDMARRGNLWEQRIAIISTYHFIRKQDFADTFTIAETLIDHRHDLIRKAVGWMLREIGNRDFEAEKVFLEKHYRQMPRTMLRYAIEKFPAVEKENFMKKG